MSESHYPTVDIETMNQFVIATGRLEKNGIDVTGEVVKYILAGPQAIYNRTMEIRLYEPGQIGFEQAMGIAARLKFVPKMVNWFETHRNWKDGAYIYRPKPK